jgi:hypothetical protein
VRRCQPVTGVGMIDAHAVIYNARGTMIDVAVF